MTHALYARTRSLARAPRHVSEPGSDGPVASGTGTVPLSGRAFGPSPLIRRDQTDTQKKVVEEAATRAAKQSAKAKKSLLKRCKELGISAADLDLIKSHIRKAEVTINFKAHQEVKSKPLPQLLSEGGVKNRFETGTSGGESDFDSREKVERDLFGYSQITEDSDLAAKTERPRYGAVNSTTSALGAADTSTYGMSALVLTEEAKKRATLTHDDSFAVKDPDLVGTFDDLDHVLLQKFQGTTGADFAKTILLHAQGKRGKTQGFAYLEVQLHDTIDVAKDVAYVRASFNEGFGTTGGEALRAMAGTKPVIWSLHGKRDQMILQPEKGPAKKHFDDMWDEVKQAREDAEGEGKPIPLGVYSSALVKFWDRLLALMPPANLYVTDDKAGSLPQISGGAKPEDRASITDAEVKLLLGKT